MSVESELDRLKFEASDERKKAVYSTTSKREERQERISVLQRSLEERIKAREQVKEKARRLMEMVRGDPRLGSSNVSEERLAAVLEANPAMRRVQAEILAIQDELATLQREGLCRLVPRSSGGVEADQHPLRTGGADDAGQRAAVSAAAAARQRRYAAAGRWAKRRPAVRELPQVRGVLRSRGQQALRWGERGVPRTVPGCHSTAWQLQVRPPSSRTG